MNGSVMVSIKPEWCNLIIQGKKTIEIRKTRPKIATPFKCYIYCTLDGSNDFLKKTLKGDVAAWNRGKWGEKKGKVIGEFICSDIEHIKEWGEGKSKLYRVLDMEKLERTCMISINDIMDYAGAGNLYFWNIKDLEIYDKPKELHNFIVNADKTFEAPALVKMKRPPQSWCYIEGVE